MAERRWRQQWWQWRRRHWQESGMSVVERKWPEYHCFKDLLLQMVVEKKVEAERKEE